MKPPIGHVSIMGHVHSLPVRRLRSEEERGGQEEDGKYNMAPLASRLLQVALGVISVLYFVFFPLAFSLFFIFDK